MVLQDGSLAESASEAVCEVHAPHMLQPEGASGTQLPAHTTRTLLHPMEGSLSGFQQPQQTAQTARTRDLNAVSRGVAPESNQLQRGRRAIARHHHSRS